MPTLTRDQVIQQFKERYGLDITNGLRFKLIDHTSNPMAPEQTAYKLSYIHPLSEQREQVTYWPNTYGAIN